MNIDELFQEFAKNVTATFSHHQYAKEHTDKELKLLTQQKKQLQSNQELLNTPMSLSFNFFYGATDGAIKAFGRRNLTIAERIKSTLTHKNKIYQWTISEVYEHFDKFCWRFYCAAGCSDPMFWPEKEYKDLGIAIDRRASLDFSERLELTTNKRNRTKETLKTLRAKRPEFTKLEKNNALQQDLKLFIVMCEQFRHQIIHAGGWLPRDKDGFIDKCLSDSGISGSAKVKHRIHVEKYIGFDGDRAYIDLLDIPHPNEHLRSIGGHFDICSDFIKIFGTYADLMVNCFASSDTNQQ